MFRRFESEPTAEDTELRFVAGILPGFAAFLAFSEAGVSATRPAAICERPRGRLGHREYARPAEGHGRAAGYWKGNRTGDPERGLRRRRGARRRRRRER